MGQYFCYSLADASEGFSPSGLKVLEHSYVGNADVFHFFLRLVDKESLLASFISSVINTSSLDDLLGSWAGKAVAHAGDYEEVDEGQKTIYENLSDKAKGRAQNQFVKALNLSRYTQKDNPWQPYTDNGYKKIMGLASSVYGSGAPIYIVNHDKKEFLDYRRYLALHRVAESKDGTLKFAVDPLSILTTTSNGMGGGDYHGMNEDTAGLWCYDRISITSAYPTDYSELFYFFREHDAHYHIDKEWVADEPEELGAVDSINHSKIEVDFMNFALTANQEVLEQMQSKYHQLLLDARTLPVEAVEA